ncbi:MAG: T9SS type A sorting domain-containing protein [Bacteroidota bacterium]
MYVHSPSGTVNQYPIDSIRKLTFPQGKMQIHGVLGDTVDYAYSSLRMFNFSNLTTDTKNNLGKNPVTKFTAFSAEGILHLTYQTISYGTLFFEVYDVHGKLVSKHSVYSDGSNTPSTAQFQLGSLSPGVYYCLMNGNNVKSTTKFTHLQ